MNTKSNEHILFLTLETANSVHTIAETPELKLVHNYEEGFLIFKQEKIAIELGSFYGDPSCGIIDKDNQWVIIGGTDRSLLWLRGVITELSFKGLHDLRQIDKTIVEILIDPWSEHSAIWRYNITTGEQKKIRDFPDYREQPFTEDVIW